MEGPQRRQPDVSELLANGFWKSSRSKSPSVSSPAAAASSFLKPSDSDRDRSRSRNRRRRPPRPIVEDEIASLAKESTSPPISDPPMRGILDQHPIILEADVTPDEAARLHAEQPSKNDNPERRFVLVPRSDGSFEDEPEQQKPPKKVQAEPRRDKEKDTLPRPPIERRKSRQDLPPLQTKAPKDIPSQFRRSASTYASSPTKSEAPRAQISRTPSGEPFLSPDVSRHPKDYFSQSAPRHHPLQEIFGRPSTPTNEKRHSGGSLSGASRPGTPEKRTTLAGTPRSRRNTNEKLSRPKQVSDEHNRDRIPSPLPDRSARTSKSSVQSRNHYSSSDDLADSSSDDEKHRKRRHHHQDHLRPENDDRHRRSSSRRSHKPSLGSRYSSPLPSPSVSPSQIPRADAFDRSDTFPIGAQDRRPNSRPVSPLSPQEGPRDRLNPMDIPRTKSRQSSAIPQKPSTPLPIPIPSRGDIPENRHDDRRSSTRPKQWQPPSFQPSSQSLEKPVGSYRRYSDEIESGITPLPSCPRTMFSRGRNDWLTLPQCPAFDICPSCYNSTIAPTEFRDFFIPAGRRPPETEVLCDFGSSPWYRIAWLLTRKERRKDLNVFYGLANIAASAQPCLGKHEAVRQWHSILDPKTDSPIRNFDVCYSCVKSIETLLPSVRGTFVRTDSHGPPGAPRVCDLRFDSKRFVQYFDALETTADMANEDGEPDTRELANLARRFALIEECQRDKDLPDRRWHIITQLPEFSVCEECFDEVVWPELEKHRAIAEMFNKTPQRIPKASCQLYSAKMRGIFRTAVDSDDYKLLASRARERKSIETAYKANIAELERQKKMGLNNSGLVVKETQRVTDEWRRWE